MLLLQWSHPVTTTARPALGGLQGLKQQHFQTRHTGGQAQPRREAQLRRGCLLPTPRTGLLEPLQLLSDQILSSGCCDQTLMSIRKEMTRNAFKQP